MKSLVFRNAHVVLADEVVAGSLEVRGRRIQSVSSGPTRRMGVDLEGDLLLPGLIELHTDNFERHMMPRPKVRWPELPALFGHDAEIAAAGITTVYDALGVGDIDPEAMRGQDLQPVLDAMRKAGEGRLLRAEHRLHIRLELPAPNTRELFRPFEDHPSVGLLSLMDHTPGQRQWTDVEQARIYYCGKKGWSSEKFERSIAEQSRSQQEHAKPNREHFVAYAKSRRIPLASHDDTLPEHVDQARGEGVSISEFPTSVAAARAAREAGLSIVMGAPNMVRGGSHSGNIGAADLARQGLLDTFSSDYVPSSLLHAAIKLVSEAGFTLPKALATVTRNPARSLGLADRGEIAPGLRADLVQVRLVGHQPVVRAVWREGERVA